MEETDGGNHDLHLWSSCSSQCCSVYFLSDQNLLSWGCSLRPLTHSLLPSLCVCTANIYRLSILHLWVAWRGFPHIYRDVSSTLCKLLKLAQKILQISLPLVFISVLTLFGQKKPRLTCKIIFKDHEFRINPENLHLCIIYQTCLH